jgi:hypothetical protein
VLNAASPPVFSILCINESLEPKTQQDAAQSQRRFQDHRHSTYWTYHGKLEVSCWTNPNEDHSFVAKIAFLPSNDGVSLSRIVLDLNSCLDPSAKITYQALRPNDSEVFEIVHSGDIRRLEQVLANGTASLNDRDEKGRTLLHVSILQPIMINIII